MAEEHNCAVHGQNMPDACVCRGAIYWMKRAKRADSDRPLLLALLRAARDMTPVVVGGSVTGSVIHAFARALDRCAGIDAGDGA